MAESTINFLQSIAKKLNDVLLPIAEAIGDESVRRDFLMSIGINPTTNEPMTVDHLSLERIRNYQGASPEDATFEGLIQTILEVNQVLKAVDSFIRLSLGSFSLNEEDGDELFNLFVNLLYTNYMKKEIPPAYQLANSLKFIDNQAIQFGGFSRFLFSMGNYFADLYGEDTWSMQTEEHAQRLSDGLLFPIALFASIVLKGEVFYGFDISGDEEDRSPADYIGNRLLSISFSGKNKDVNNTIVDGKILLQAVLIPAEHANGKGGLLLRVQFEGGFEFPITSQLTLKVRSIAPDWNINFGTDLNIPNSTNAGLNITIEYASQKTRKVILGNINGTHIFFGKLLAEGKLDLQNQGFEVAAKESKLTFSANDLGFMQYVFPSDVEFPFDLGIGISKSKGFYIKGGLGLLTSIPIHKDLLGVHFDTMTIGLTLSEKKLSSEASIGISFDIGDIKFVVDRLGIELKIGSDDDKGSLLNSPAKIGFKPPNGLGLSIDAGAVIGGGYLFFDFEKEEYAGVLELTIAGFISAKAIGLITTKMPDGSKGFSMIIIITAEFNPPLQLGYGFTLNGIGGLLGLNRTVLLDPLRDGVRTGAVNNIMFPTNVIANAPRIISDLKAIFPPYEGKFLIGPMAKIGWGTPSLITLSFGLIIEIPGNIAILGVLKLILPDEKIPIVKIQVAFVGTIDFDKKMLTFDASLYESNILQTMTLEGDMAVRLAWGDQPNFIMTVGGFHPSYTPPPLALPTLKRLAISILNTSIARIRVECYQAVTSNTVQFGARAEIFFDLKACSIDGHIGFDALFQFNPFYFIIELAAGFKLKAVGISLMTVRVKMLLEGPTPWRAKGTGSVSLLFFDISANFDKTWGDSKTTTLPEITILPQFIEQLQKKEQWSTVLSTGKNLLVSLRKLDEATENLLVLHPAGSLVLQQKLLPLKVNIDKIGNQKTADVKQLTIESASSNNIPLSIKEVKESFARAQYQNLSNTEKLSKPSFEKMQGGVEISMGENTVQNGKMVRKKIEYELTIIDKEPIKPFRFGKFFLEPGIMFNHFIKGNSVSKSKLSKSTIEKLQPFEHKLEMQDELFTVAFQNNNRAFSQAAIFSSEMEAQSFMQEQIKSNPNMKKQIHIVPQFELQAL